MAELLIQQRFQASDVESAGAAIRSVLGDVVASGETALDYRQQSAIDDGVSVTRLESVGSSISVAVTDAPDLTVVAVREGTLQLVTSSSTTDLSAGDLGVICLGSATELRWNRVTADLYTFPPATIGRLLGSDANRLRLRCAHATPRSPALSVLWHRTASVLAVNVLQHRELFESDLVREQAIDALVAVSVEAFGIADASEDEVESDARIAALAIVYMREHLGAPITVPDVARSVDVSVRKLQLVFRRIGNGTPSLFLRQLRMDAARASLLRTGTGRASSVGTIARQLTYSNLGRFSAHYRAAFGETPIETLRSTQAADRS